MVIKFIQFCKSSKILVVLQNFDKSSGLVGELSMLLRRTCQMQVFQGYAVSPAAIILLVSFSTCCC